MTRTDPSRTASGSGLQLFRIGALASLAVLLWQFVTAGQLVSGQDLTALHAVGAVALHVTTAITLLGAFLHWRGSRADQPLLIVAAVVFLAAFAQAALGSAGNMALHVPGALVITVGVVWLAAWALRAPR